MSNDDATTHECVCGGELLCDNGFWLHARIEDFSHTPTPVNPLVRTLYSDEHGVDLLVDDKHNVNLGWERGSHAIITHHTRDNKPMEVHFNSALRTYFIVVER